MCQMLGHYLHHKFVLFETPSGVDPLGALKETLANEYCAVMEACAAHYQ